jgi:hypothetical protein
VRRDGTSTLSGRQINGLTQGSYYGNDASNATNYPIVRLESTSSPHVYYCRTTNFSTMGLQTGTAVHSCSFTVPSTVPLGSYRIVVVANGIASASQNISVSLDGLKGLKVEIKEKAEVAENVKDLVDVRVKRNPDIDLKITENLELIRHFEEQWVETVRKVAQSVDEAAGELSRTFIGVEERPFVGVPEPLVEELTPRKITAAEARRAREKKVFADGGVGKVGSREMEEFHRLVHELFKSGGNEIEVTRPRTVKKSTAKSTKSTARTTRRKRS